MVRYLTESTFLVLVTLCLVMTAVRGQQSAAVCQMLIYKLDCGADPPSPVCSSTGKTFRTRCDFAKAHCSDTSVHLVHDGDCLPAEQSIADPICPQLTNFTCSASSRSAVQVCATDGNTYASLCEFQLARCSRPGLRPASLGQCAGNVFALICKAIENETCPSDSAPVCGSDNITYDNICKLEKAACINDGLHVEHSNAC